MAKLGQKLNKYGRGCPASTGVIMINFLNVQKRDFYFYLLNYSAIKRNLNIFLLPGKHCGEVVQLGGTRALLNLFQENTKAGKVSSAHAIAKIAIKMNPALAFSGQR